MAPRPNTSEPFTCVTCEIEISGPVTFHVGLPFCCAGCAADGPCICTYDERPPEPQVRHCRDLSEPVLSVVARSSAGDKIPVRS